MRYVIAGLFSLCLGLQPGVGLVAADAQPAPQCWLLFVRDGKVWAVTSDGAETKGPLAVGGPVNHLLASPDGRYLCAVTGHDNDLHMFRLLPDFEVAEVGGPRPVLSQVRDWSWSPDGLYIAALREDDGRLQIVRVLPHLEVAEVRAVALRVGRVHWCWWSPNGRYLTISTKDTMHILSWRAGQAESPEEPLLLPPLLSVPSESAVWSPDSDAIAYRDPTASFPSFAKGIWVTDVLSGHTRQIQLADWAHLYDLSWSPDGRVFTYGGWDGLRSVPADGSEEESFLVEGKRQWFEHPRWSPDGAFLAYMRTGGLWVLSTRSGANTRLTADGIFAWEPSLSWSHDGTLVSFSADGPRAEGQPGDYALYVADPASGAVTRVAGGLGCFLDPLWLAVWLPPGAPWGNDD